MALKNMRNMNSEERLKYWWEIIREIVADHQKTNRWPKFFNDEKYGSFMENQIVKPMKKTPVGLNSNQILYLRRNKVPREGQKGGASKSGGTLTRVKEALATNQKPESEDIRELRRKYNQGQLSNEAYNQLKEAGIDLLV